MKIRFLIVIVMMSMISIPVMGGNIVNANMDVGFGNVNITATGFDSSTWHPGSIGQQNQLMATGGFIGTYSVNQGNYGSLNSYVNLNSYPGGADFVFQDYQDFNVLSANHTNNVEGTFYARAAGNNDQVAMNLKSVGSMYVWSEATNPYSAPSLQGNYIAKEVTTKKDGILKTDLGLSVSTDGLATMSNSNIWGWTNGETGTSSTNYSGGIRNVTATGSGQLVQFGLGTNSLTYNADYVLPGGGSATGGIVSFNNGLNGTYSMSAN